MRFSVAYSHCQSQTTEPFVDAADVAQEIGSAAGREVQFLQISHDEFSGAMVLLVPGSLGRAQTPSWLTVSNARPRP
jgi:hypothetical protein